MLPLFARDQHKNHRVALLAWGLTRHITRTRKLTEDAEVRFNSSKAKRRRGKISFTSSRDNAIVNLSLTESLSLYPILSPGLVQSGRRRCRSTPPHLLLFLLIEVDWSGWKVLEVLWLVQMIDWQAAGWVRPKTSRGVGMLIQCNQFFKRFSGY